MRFAPLLLALISSAALADIQPVPDPGDARMGIVHYAKNERINLEVLVGRAIVVMLPAGEVLSAISVEAPDAWQVIAERDAESFTLRPNFASPNTTMSVQTDVRSYSFVLSSSPSRRALSVVRIIDASSSTEAREAGQSDLPASSWRMSGDRELWPTTIRDDGSKTYIDWPADRPIPAVFALDALRREEMVNGYVRGTTFTIDRVYDRLLFRIDRAKAEARRKRARTER